MVDTKQRYILALDQGTTSSRAIIFDRSNNIVALAQKEYDQLFPQPGWVEHRPEDIWNSQLEVAKSAMHQAELTADDIGAIGITNQRETTLIWDRKTGEPIYNAIVWQCRRTVPECDRLVSLGTGPTFTAKTGLVIDAYFSGTKIKWLLDNVPGARERAEKGELAFGTVDTWLIWKLTGGRVHATDVSNASRTLLFNIHAARWDQELLDILDVPASLLPTVCPSSHYYGDCASELFGGSIPITGNAGDQQAALFGQACYSAGTAKNTYGTGSFLLMNTGDKPVKSDHGLLTTIGWQLADQPIQYALEGSVFITGAAIQWLRDGLAIISSAAESEPLATSVSDSAGVYFVPAFVGLGTPYWDSTARGAILGLTRGTTRAHLVRATLEAVAYQSKDVLDAMVRDSGIQLKEVRVDGGMTVNNFLMQFQADLLGVPVVRPVVNETTALGAAYLAGLAVGYWNSQEEIAEMWQEDARYRPTISRDYANALCAGWQRAVERSRGWEVPASVVANPV